MQVRGELMRESESREDRIKQEMRNSMQVMKDKKLTFNVCS